MNKYLLLFFLIGLCQTGLGQHIERDFFGELVYRSPRGGYEANLEKDIFKDLNFTDNQGNKVTFKRKYIEQEYGDMLDNEHDEKVFFISLVREFRREKNYEAVYSIDIFDQLIIEDNRNNKIKEGKDIFGNYNREEIRNGRRIYIQKEPDGGLRFENDHEKASLEDNIFGEWVYEDSNGNKLEFSKKTWKELKHKYGNNEAIFDFFLNEFLFIH
ncbi:hypothetical protein IFO69_04370 [Echinicola sp. CAU 1574]|uniref:Uncharacterized protein n=1 Tax=Echinicola arenosa TaxID=2774144 RepID=A0ABR9AGJ3_9BACT|nr:hypothetical protein [Echinicola arenosa]MBD8487977.1 hypothetical protein [Echinicola arenosa]